MSVAFGYVKRLKYQGRSSSGVEFEYIEAKVGKKGTAKSAKVAKKLKTGRVSVAFGYVKRLKYQGRSSSGVEMLSG